MFYKSISPQETAEKLKNGENFRIIDVREPQEFEIARIEEAELLPLSSFHEWIETLKPEEEIVVLCHHGIRSAFVCKILSSNGFERVFNLEGGIDLWSVEVDREIPRY